MSTIKSPKSTGSRNVETGLKPVSTTGTLKIVKNSDQLLKILKSKQKIRLDVGCGNNKQPGFVGMDKRSTPHTDLLHDAERFPWPLPDGSCSIVLMSHLVEHIKPWLQIDLLDECWRVLEHSGMLMISTPYATSFGYSQDPTHCSPWNEATPMYFVKSHPLYGIYKPKPWLPEKIVWDIQKNMEIILRKDVTSE
jgi:predicted SAM-dependent methyltransferase